MAGTLKKSWLMDPVEARRTFSWHAPESCEVVDGQIRLVESKFTLCSPLECSDFFTSFAQLAGRGEVSEARVQRWVLRYGLPQRGRGPGEFRPRGTENAPAVMSMTQLIDEAQQANKLLNLLVQIRGKDVETIRNRVLAPRSQLDHELACEVFACEDDKELDHALRREVLRTKDEPYILFAGRQILADVITELVSGVMLRAHVLSPSETTQFWRCPDTLSALHLQLFLIYTENRPLRRCENPACGRPFAATRRDKRYCGPSCRSNARHYP